MKNFLPTVNGRRYALPWIWGALCLICCLVPVTSQAAASLSKSYMEGMPPANDIAAKIKGANGFDTLARQSAAALILRKAAETLTEGRYLHNQTTEAERYQLGAYRSAEANTTRKGYAYAIGNCWGDITAAGLQEAVDLAGASSPPGNLNCGHLFFRLASHYEFDETFISQVRTTLIVPATLERLRRQEAKDEAWHRENRAKQEAAQREAETAFNRKPEPVRSSAKSPKNFLLGLLTKYESEILVYLLLAAAVMVAAARRKVGLDANNPMQLLFGRGRYRVQIETGEVVHSDHHTSVSSYTTSSTQYIDGQAVTIETPHVTSTTFQKFFLKMADGSEQHFSLVEGAFSVRPGHIVSELAVFKEGEQSGLRILLFNHNTGEMYAWDANIETLVGGSVWLAVLVSLPGLMLPYIPFAIIRRILIAIRRKALMQFIERHYLPRMKSNEVLLEQSAVA